MLRTRDAEGRWLPSTSVSGLYNHVHLHDAPVPEWQAPKGFQAKDHESHEISGRKRWIDKVFAPASLQVHCLAIFTK